MSSPKRFGYERRDVNLSALGKFTVGLFIFTGLVLLTMKWLFQLFFAHQLSQEPQAPPMLQVVEPAPSLKLEEYEGQVLAETRAAEKPLLTEYTWIDEKGGIARIPIERAMEILVSEASKNFEQEDREEREGGRK